MGSVGCTCFCQPSRELAQQQKKANAPGEYSPGDGTSEELESRAFCWKGTSDSLCESLPASVQTKEDLRKKPACLDLEEVASYSGPRASSSDDASARALRQADASGAGNGLVLPISRRSESQNVRETNQSLLSQLRTMSGLAPMRVIRFDALKAYKELPRSDSGLAVLHETLDPKTKVIFLSHRWLRPWQTQEECESHGCTWAGQPHPDDMQKTKFALLIHAVENISEQKRRLAKEAGRESEEEWDLSSVAVWLDFACIDQDDVALRTAGVGSLLGYMSRCDLVVIPTLQRPDHATVHRMKTRKVDENQDQNADTDNYGVRAWTRLESMCFYVLSLLRDQETPELYYSAPGDLVGKMDYVLLPYTLPSKGTLTLASDLDVVSGHERTLLSVLHEAAIGGVRASQGPAMVAAAAATELKICASSGEQKTYLQDLLQHGLDPNTQDNQGLTALWSASWLGLADQIQLLLESRADPNMSASSGLAAMHNAARKGHLEIARLLLDHRADLELQDKQGNTPLMWAIQYNRPEAATFILDSGATEKVVKALQLAKKLQYEPFVSMIMDRFTEEEGGMTQATSVESSLSRAVVRARRVSVGSVHGSASEIDISYFPTTPSVTATTLQFYTTASTISSPRSLSPFDEEGRANGGSRSAATEAAELSVPRVLATAGRAKSSPARRVNFQLSRMFRGGWRQQTDATPAE